MSVKKVRKVVSVCTGKSCSIFGADETISLLRKSTSNQLENDGVEYEINEVECLDKCSFAPNIDINGEVLNQLGGHEAVEVVMGEHRCCKQDNIETKADSVPQIEDILKDENDFLGDLG